jgi:alpha-D-ribose 1-methylphosphonate 5-triphosphate synthase subunit PhnG
LRWAALALSLLAGAGLLWTFSRSSLVALAAGLVVLAAIRRRPAELTAAVAVIAVAIGWAHLFPKVGSTGTFTKVDKTYLREIGKGGPKSFSAASSSEPSLQEHWRALKDGVHTMIHHPQGYGLGNVGQTASRTGTPLKAGESNYTELGVELGVLGAILWIAWGLAVLIGLVRKREARMAAAFAAILALAVQTDVIGDPWVAYCVWALAGALLTRPQERLAPARAAAVASS